MNLDTEFARKNMVLQQIRCWDVSSPSILNTLKNVPRELFVPEQYANLAFADVMLPLGKDDTGHEHRMLKPQLEGRILQELKVQPTDRALVIGTGSGYLTACLAQLTRHVTSIDLSADMTSLAEKRSSDVGEINNLLEAGKKGLYRAAKKYKKKDHADRFQIFALDFIEQEMNRVQGTGGGFLSRIFGGS
jgi:protein-L-isoaspartate(D-aspartate) O-methyltransferase